MYKFEKEIEPVNISNILREIDEELFEYNNSEWSFVWNSPEKLVKKFNEEKRYTSFWYADFTTHVIIGECCDYWCGCLTAEPFCELDMLEEQLLNIMLYDHAEFVLDEQSKDILFVFKANENSELHEFFLEYTDGYGENISASFNCMRAFALRVWKKRIDKDLEKDATNKYGEWRCNLTEEEYETLYCNRF